jgi:hypothetical protein
MVKGYEREKTAYLAEVLISFSKFINVAKISDTHDLCALSSRRLENQPEVLQTYLFCRG